jgi:hypothetical protein
MSLGALGRAPPCLARDPPWERSKLGFHKISLVKIFLIRNPSLPVPYLPRPDSKLCKFGVQVVCHEIIFNLGIHFLL